MRYAWNPANHVCLHTHTRSFVFLYLQGQCCHTLIAKGPLTCSGNHYMGSTAGCVAYSRTLTVKFNGLPQRDYMAFFVVFLRNVFFLVTLLWKKKVFFSRHGKALLSQGPLKDKPYEITCVRVLPHTHRVEQLWDPVTPAGVPNSPQRAAEWQIWKEKN